MSILTTQGKKAIRYNHSHLLKNLDSFSKQHNVGATMLPYLLLYAAEDYFTSIYYPIRYGRILRNERILSNPKDLNSTPIIYNIRRDPLDVQSNKCVFDFIFPLAHRNLELIRYGYAQQVLSAYSEHAIMLKPIEEHHPLTPRYIKFVTTGSIASAKIPIQSLTEMVMPSLAHHFLPLFAKREQCSVPRQSECKSQTCSRKKCIK